jgi:hypothetical protein
MCSTSDQQLDNRSFCRGRVATKQVGLPEALGDRARRPHRRAGENGGRGQDCRGEDCGRSTCGCLCGAGGVAEPRACSPTRDSHRSAIDACQCGSGWTCECRLGGGPSQRTFTSTLTALSIRPVAQAQLHPASAQGGDNGPNSTPHQLCSNLNLHEGSGELDFRRLRGMVILTRVRGSNEAASGQREPPGRIRRPGATSKLRLGVSGESPAIFCSSCECHYCHSKFQRAGSSRQWPRPAAPSTTASVAASVRAVRPVPRRGDAGPGPGPRDPN